jgi:hypothetical protein
MPRDIRLSGISQLGAGDLAFFTGSGKAHLGVDAERENFMFVVEAIGDGQYFALPGQGTSVSMMATSLLC